MFKKKPTIKPLAPLRSSDRRKLADQIISVYHLDREPAAASEEQTPEQKVESTAARTSLRNALLPDNVQSARFTTTHGPELRQASGTFYVGSQDGDESRILWFQIDEGIFPSVYTLWKIPDMVALLHTPGIVVKKLQGGADLMTPGLAGGPPFPSRATKGAVVAVASIENPSVPVAVGRCEVDVSMLEKVQGMKGHAVETMHWAGDEIWSFSVSGKSGQEPPNELKGWSKVLDHGSLSDQVDNLSIDDQDTDGGVALEENNSQVQSELSKDTPAATEGNVDSAEAPPEQPTELTQKEIDEAFRSAFLFGIHKHKTSNRSNPNYGLDFPLSQSFVMSTLVQPFLPAYTPQEAQQLQIKKTSWKNIKKFVKSLDKEKIIKSKEKDGHETVITDVDFEDPSIVNFKPYRLPKKETAGGSALGRGETDKIDGHDDSIGQKLHVISYFRPTSKLQPLFDTASASKPLYTPPEVRESVTAYIESENLASETNKRLVKLNPTLANAVFDGSGSLDKEVLAKGSVPRDALIDRILKGMANSYAIVRNGADASGVKAKSGAPPKVHITLETRGGNKTVTKVSGLEAYHVSPRPLADELRKICAGSTSIEPLAGATKKNEKEVMEVMIQGPQQDAVAKALERRGVHKQWIEVLDKTKGKKR